MARIGIEWVQKYHGRANNLSKTKEQAEAFYNTLTGVRAFNWGDDLAWDQDFEESGKGAPAAGTDTTWIDNVDIAYFSGHGSSTGFLFGVAGSDDGQAAATDIKWGNKDLEWIVLDACQVLESGTAFSRWGWPVFAGLHYILGFHTTCSDEGKRGRYFAQYLNAGWTVRQAWIKASQDTEDSSVQWAYLRADDGASDTFNDHWWGEGFVSSDPTNPTTLFYARGAC
jgi:Family of unknown function (DUF6345)